MRLQNVVLFAALAAVLSAQERPAIREVAVHGTPWERGFQHGTQMRDEIAELLGKWDVSLRKDLQVERAAFVTKFLAATQFDAAARKWTPELLDEVRGIAAGCGQSYETMLVWQLVDELWVHAGAITREKCTTIGVDRRGEQPTIVAQNLDIPQWYHGFQTVLRIRDESRGIESLVVTLPGLVGAAGVSSQRVAVGVNTLMQLRPCRDGLPVAFVVRGLLTQKDHAAALAFLHGIVHASGQNYTVGGPETAPGYECSAGQVVQFKPYADSTFTYHTNHPLANDDFTRRWLLHAQDKGQGPFDLVSCPRFQTCSRHMPVSAQPTVDDVVQTLASRESQPSVCNDSTYCTLVMVLGEKPELRVRAGRDGEFEILRLGR